MPHRTKLYQQARSPLIQGRSRIERPVWQSTSMGAFVAFAGSMAVLAVDIAGELWFFVPETDGGMAALLPVPAVAVGGAALLGGYMGAQLAVRMGWHKGWRTALIVAALFDLVVCLIVV